MKSVAKVNIDGLYLEEEVVDDAFSGVVPFYAQPDNTVKDADTAPTTPEIAGYKVGVPITTPGLYKPRFDIAAWETYQAAVYEAQEAFIAEWHDWKTKGNGVGEQPIYVPPAEPALWAEGLTPEKITELTQPSAPSEGDKLRQRLKDLELVITELMLGE